MSTTESRDISEILERIRTWTPGMRIVLAREVLETLESASLSKPTRFVIILPPIILPSWNCDAIIWQNDGGRMMQS